MARPSIHKLLLNYEELEWIVKQVNRKATLAEKVTKDKKLKAIVLGFADKLAAPPQPEPGKPDSYILNTNRHELRYLENLVGAAHAAFIATVIPGYDEKASKGGEHAAHFRAAHAEALETAIMLASLLNKIKRSL